MPTEKEVYEQHADQYERLIRREDYEGNILRAIEQIVPLPGLEVVELGAGTGRLTRLLAPRVRAIRAFDGSRHMLDVAEESLRQMGLANWQAGVADNRAIPVADASADLVISGWSFCYLAVWGGPSTGSGWLGELEKGYGEIKRILRPGGLPSFWKRWARATNRPIRRNTWPGIMAGSRRWDSNPPGFGRIIVSNRWRRPGN